MKAKMVLKKGRAYQCLFVDGHYIASVWGTVDEVEEYREGWWIVMVNGTSFFGHVNEVVWESAVES